MALAKDAEERFDARVLVGLIAGGEAVEHVEVAAEQVGEDAAMERVGAHIGGATHEVEKLARPAVGAVYGARQSEGAVIRLDVDDGQAVAHSQVGNEVQRVERRGEKVAQHVAALRHVDGLLQREPHRGGNDERWVEHQRHATARHLLQRDPAGCLARRQVVKAAHKACYLLAVERHLAEAEARGVGRERMAGGVGK